MDLSFLHLRWSAIVDGSKGGQHDCATIEEKLKDEDTRKTFFKKVG